MSSESGSSPHVSSVDVTEPVEKNNDLTIQKACNVTKEDKIRKVHHRMSENKLKYNS